MNKYDKNGYCLMDEIVALLSLVFVIALVIGVLAIDVEILDWLGLSSSSEFEKFIWVNIINAFPFVLTAFIYRIYEKIQERKKEQKAKKLEEEKNEEGSVVIDSDDENKLN